MKYSLIDFKNKTWTLQSSIGTKFIFPSDDSASGHYTAPTKGWIRIRGELAKQGIENIRLDDLRRTLASWQASTGSSLQVIAKTVLVLE